MNKLIKKIFFIVTILYFVLSVFVPLKASAAKQVNLYFFRGEGCPHCAEEEDFLEGIKDKYPFVKIYDFEIWYNRDNQKLFSEVGKRLNIDVGGVPLTVIGDKHFIGFSRERTGKDIEDALNYYSENNCKDVVADIVGVPNPNQDQECATEDKKSSSLPESVHLPLVGEVKTKSFSLPVLTALFGTLDGFNPCSLWVLLFLISLLIGTNSRKKMLLLGGAFILTEALSYALFMTAWLNLILFIGIIFWVRFAIGTLALGGGGYNLVSYLKNRKKDSGCEVVGEEKRTKTFGKIENIIKEEKFLLAVVGVVVLAFSVNLIELLCSAGLPAVYTQILSMSDLSRLQYFLYILLYIFFFMLDDFIVFFLALFTLRLTGVSTKYSKYSHLIGGILMVIVGILLIFKPGWLMFG